MYIRASPLDCAGSKLASLGGGRWCHPSRLEQAQRPCPPTCIWSTMKLQRSAFDRAAQEVFEMMHWYGTGGSWWAVALMVVGMLAVWALIVWAIIPMLVGESRRKVRELPDRARSTLDERLARGEIANDEYHSRIEAPPTAMPLRRPQ